MAVETRLKDKKKQSEKKKNREKGLRQELEDGKDYITYLSEVAKEVDGWPAEMKTRRYTVFYEDLKTPQNKKTNKGNEKKESHQSLT